MMKLGGASGTLTVRAILSQREWIVAHLHLKRLRKRVTRQSTSSAPATRRGKPDSVRREIIRNVVKNRSGLLQELAKH